ncbi:SURF1 family protein [Zhongshania guokunii]|uniref:SURF1-like protein n=1 Tax=Zhongshania guokunii TaxID=641783 RepID=A0ABV3U2F5_9GAMM
MAASPSRFQWQFDWKSLLVIVLILPILLSLGFWQLNRADEKAALLADFEQRRNFAPVAIGGLAEYPNYLPVFALGEFDAERYWLLDNRISHGRFGYEIMAIFTLTDGRELLVNRGWIAGDRARQILPAIAIPSGTVKIAGELYRNTEKAFSLGVEPVAAAWPRRQQWLDIDDLGGEFPDLLPTTLRLAGDSVGALEIERVVVNVTPAKHTGYAVQWFAMAFALGLIFIFRNSNLGLWLKRSKSNESNKQ